MKLATKLHSIRTSIFIRGLGGFGGERGPSGNANVSPERPPDAIHEEKTRPDQALLYRLSGDPNPLHADSGMATFGFGGRAVLKYYYDNDPARLQSIKVRFTKHVFTGETLVTEMWHEPDKQRVLFQMKVAERDQLVISNAAVELKNNS